MKQYMLIAKGTRAAWDATGDKDWQDVMQGFDKWISKMKEKDLWIRGDRLTSKRVDITKTRENYQIHDGPFAETKALTGFFLFRAEDMNQAIEYSKGCPSMLHDSLSLHELEGDQK